MDPTAKQQFIFRLEGLSGSMKKHIEEKPQYAGIFEIDPTTPKHVIKRGDVAKLVACRIIPAIREGFEHYGDEEELVWEAGLFDEKRLDDGITEVDKKVAKELLQSLLEELG